MKNKNVKMLYVDHIYFRSSNEKTPLVGVWENKNCARNNGTGIKTVNWSWKDLRGKNCTKVIRVERRNISKWKWIVLSIKQQHSSRLLFLLLYKKVSIARLTPLNALLNLPISLLFLKRSQWYCAAHRVFHPNFSVIHNLGV